MSHYPSARGEVGTRLPAWPRAIGALVSWRHGQNLLTPHPTEQAVKIGVSPRPTTPPPFSLPLTTLAPSLERRRPAALGSELLQSHSWALCL